MSRINTNVTSLIAQRVLRRNNDALNTSLERLSTGLKINRGADNPAGLIASEVLRAEKVGIAQAIDNAERASNIIGTAEGGLQEVNSLLTELQTLVTEAANTGGLSAEEVAANQLQVDSILNTINRIAQSTNFEGKKLLNGTYDYSTSGATNVANVQVNAARIPDGAAYVTVAASVTTAAAKGTLSLMSDAATSAIVTLEITGNNGTEQVTVGSGATQADLQTAINALTDNTGVSALISGGALYVKSVKYGSDQFVTVAVKSDPQGDVTGGTGYGTDAVVSVNGASATVKGIDVTFRNTNIDVEFQLDATSNVDGGSADFDITGGGATFALGSKVSETTKASIGIASVSAGSLGDDTDGYLSTLGTGGTNQMNSDNLVTAQRIIDKAIKQVSQLRGRLGAFQKFTLGATINNLGVAYENASAAESAIRDTDFAEETANLTRSQILTQAATTVLAQANASPQNALALLRG